MAYGRLAVASIGSIDQNFVVYTVPTKCLFAEITVDILNTNSTTDATLQLAVTAADTPTTDEYLEKGAIIPQKGGSFQRAGIMASPGERVVVQLNQTGGVVRVSGKEVIRNT